MKIVTLVKQVPDTETKIKLRSDGSGIDEEGIKWVMNPYDEFAVEEALRIKEKLGTGEVVVLSLGPERAVESIRTALAMGADRAIHLKDEALLGGDVLSTAKALSAALKKEGFDLLICGKQAIDDDWASVPSMIAQFLGIPQVNVVSKLEISDGKIKAWRDIEGGVKLVIEAPLPALVTATKGLNEPRYASLPGIMKAKRKEVKVWSVADLGLDANEVGSNGAKVKIVAWSLPPERKAGTVIKDGEPIDKVKKLIEWLKNEAKII